MAAPLVGSPVLGLGGLPAGDPAAPKIKCMRCGGANPPGMAFCQFCGTRVQPEAVAPGALNAPSAHAAQASQMGPGAVGASAPPRASVRGARLVIIAQDGTPGREYLLSEQTDIGRDEGDIRLPNDPYVSSRHARICHNSEQGRLSVRDLGSVNGVYVRLRRPTRLEHADLVLIGLEVLRFEVVSDAEKGLGPAAERGAQLFGSPAAPRYARLCQRTVEGVTRDVFYLTRDETTVGREAGDIVFTSDPFMSRRHAAITREARPGQSGHEARFHLRDLGSSNGTYLAIRGETELESGDHIRIGQHLFRLDIDPSGQF